MDNTNSWLRSPAYNLSGKRHVQISAWIKFDLELGFDFVYPEYSTDGGTTWTSLDSFTGLQSTWMQINYDVPALDNQASVRLRFNLQSDGGVTADGIYIDDIAMSYEPYICEGPTAPSAPVLVMPSNGTVTPDPLVTFEWGDSGQGGLPAGYVVNIDAVSSITLTYPTTSTAVTLTTGVHAWNVAAYNDQGLLLPKRGQLRFAGAPGVPTLLSPVDLSVASSAIVTFTWTAGSGGSPDGDHFLLDGEVITLTSTVPQLVMTLTPGAHTWSVAAYNGVAVSGYTDTWVVYVPYPVYLPLVEK